MKVYLSKINESWVVDRMREEWYENNQEYSVENPKEADLIWIISPWLWKKESKKNMKSKTLNCPNGTWIRVIVWKIKWNLAACVKCSIIYWVIYAPVAFCFVIIWKSKDRAIGSPHSHKLSMKGRSNKVKFIISYRIWWENQSWIINIYFHRMNCDSLYILF